MLFTMSVTVTLKLRMETALALQGQAKENRDARDLKRLACDLAIELKPVHPGKNDPQLAPYFMTTVPDRNAAEDIIRKLTALKGVEGAYLKPADELP